MGTKRLSLFIWLFLLAAAAPARSEFFQWTDARGVIHFTDDLQYVPEALRDSPLLITRKEGEFTGSFSEIPVPEVSIQEPIPGPRQPPPPTPAIPEIVPPGPTTLNYNPQETTIIVVNNGVRRFVRDHPGLSGKGGKPAFRPNFEDRRFIHPSVFDGGSRQFIHPSVFGGGSRQFVEPESFRSARSGKPVSKK